MKVKFIPILLLLILAFSACVGQGEAEVLQASTNTLQVLPTLTVTPILTATHTPTPSPTRTPANTPTPLPEVRILTEGNGMQSPGPWLIFRTQDGIYLVSQNGREIGLIPNEENYVINDIYAAPSGGIYAVYQAVDLYKDQILTIRTVQDHQTLFSIDLMSYDGPELRYDSEDIYNFYDDDRKAVAGTMGWSHNGQYLAFIGSINGYSSDLYTYDLETEQLTQITDTFTQSADFYWTPDDEYIYFAEVDKIWFGKSGYGHIGWSFFTAAPNGQNINQVFRSTVEERGEEWVLGWYSNEQVVMVSDYWWCIDDDFRLVNVKTGAVDIIWDVKISDYAFDPNSKKALVYIRPYDGSFDECKSEMDAGLYLVSVPDGQVEEVDFILDSSEPWVSVKWDNVASQFLLDFDYGWAYVSLAGEVITYHDEPIISPNGEWIAFMEAYGDYLYITDREGNQKIKLETKGETEYPIWSLDEETLYFFHKQSEGTYTLYMAQAPNFEPVLLTNGLSIFNRNPPQWGMP